MNNTALKIAVNMLAKRDYSIVELSNKLLQKSYTSDEINKAIIVLKQKGYLDDASLCEKLFFKYYQTHKYSANYVAKKLLAQGFDENDILNNIDKVELLDEVDIAKSILRKKYSNFIEYDKEILVKFLLNKGFSHQTIENIL